MIKSITFAVVMFVLAVNNTLYSQAIPAPQEASYSFNEENPTSQVKFCVPAFAAGIEQTKDAAALFFKLFEAYLEASSDGEVNFMDVHYLLGPAMLLIPAFSGATQIVNELANLNDEKIKELLKIADEYKLGIHAHKVKQVFKTLLVLAQTYFVFNNSPHPTL